MSADSDRRRLLEEADYWAMSDLQDLQKGLSCPLLLWLNGAVEGASSLAMALSVHCEQYCSPNFGCIELGQETGQMKS